MRGWPVRWRRNGQPARIDIGERYLAHLRYDLMNVPPPHVAQHATAEKQQSVRDILDGRARMSGAITMIGEKRLVHLQMAIRDILRREIPGDLLEAGSWHGGACIYMRACLDVFGCRNRIVYACDAFDDGFPAPDPQYPLDSESTLHTRNYFKTPQHLVKLYCAAYGYDDPQLQVVPGYFKDTLPTLPIQALALLRLDGDLYGSTLDTLTVLYDKVSPGGYVIADDYFAIMNTQRAVDDFRADRGITEPMHQCDWASAFWQKEAA